MKKTVLFPVRKKIAFEERLMAEQPVTMNIAEETVSQCILPHFLRWAVVKKVRTVEIRKHRRQEQKPHHLELLMDGQKTGVQLPRELFTAISDWMLEIRTQAIYRPHIHHQKRSRHKGWVIQNDGKPSSGSSMSRIAAQIPIVAAAVNMRQKTPAVP